MKRVIAMLMALCMAASLAGCGSTQTASSAPASSQAASSQAQTEAEYAATETADVVIIGARRRGPVRRK